MRLCTEFRTVCGTDCHQAATPALFCPAEWQLPANNHSQQGRTPDLISTGFRTAQSIAINQSRHIRSNPCRPSKEAVPKSTQTTFLRHTQWKSWVGIPHRNSLERHWRTGVKSKLFRQNSETPGLGYHLLNLPCKVLDIPNEHSGHWTDPGDCCCAAPSSQNNQTSRAFLYPQHA